VSVLHPDVVLKAGDLEVIGGRTVAGRASTFRRFAAMADVRFAVIGGEAGFVTFVDGQPFSVMAFTVRDGKIVAIDALADPARLAELDLTVLD